MMPFHPTSGISRFSAEDLTSNSKAIWERQQRQRGIKTFQGSPKPLIVYQLETKVVLEMVAIPFSRKRGLKKKSLLFVVLLVVLNGEVTTAPEEEQPNRDGKE